MGAGGPEEGAAVGRGEVGGVSGLGVLLGGHRGGGGGGGGNLGGPPNAGGVGGGKQGGVDGAGKRWVEGEDVEGF